MVVYNMKNPLESILTSIEFVQQNSPDIQTLIKDLHDLIDLDQHVEEHVFFL